MAAELSHFGNPSLNLASKYLAYQYANMNLRISNLIFVT